MSTNGILDFQNTNKVIFRGTDSNVVVDTSNASIGIGIQGTEKPGSNLHVIGDASISSNLKLTTDTSITVNSNVVTDFNGPHARLPITQAIVEHPIMHIDQTAERPKLWTANDNSSNISVKAGYTVTASTVFNSGVSNFDVFRLYDGHPDGNAGTYYCSGGTAGNGTSYSSTSGLYRDTTTSGGYSGYGGTPITTTVSGVSKAGEWLGIETPHPIVLKYVTMTSESHETYAHASPHKGVFAGSHDGVTWESISTFDDFMAGTDGTTRGNGNGTTDINIGPHRLDVNSTTAYKYHRMIVEAIQTTYGSAGGGAYLILDEMRWYGCNDNPPAGDTSIDTTFKSVMNTPQTTGANVYVDAKLSSDFTNQVTGPTGVGPAVTHDNTNKYWEMNGQLTSNITVEANTFLEGDQPHAVSVWFNSSNLEANVSNTCVFSIASEEKLDSVNLDLQSNTWHNLTYSYQGEGGSRVTYLDGRKVTEEQAEDTFGDYPPFGMTGFSQDGYVVSSSDVFANYQPYLAFNKLVNTQSDYWFAGDNTGGVGIDGYTGSVGGDHSYIGSDNLGGYTGIWIKLEMPHKLALSYLEFYQVNGSMIYTPRDFYVIGSNDDITWDLIHRETSTAADSTFTSGRAITTNSVNNHNKYKYIAIVVDRTVNDNRLGIGEIKLYGHRENDLVRLPDPTNVLEYPHITMTGPAQRGYVASASSILTSEYQAFKMFADDAAAQPSPYGGKGWWASQHNKYRQSGDNDYLGGTTDNLGTYTGSSTATDNGVWVQLKMPHKILLSSVFLGNAAWYETAPGSFKIYGTNNDQDWTLIQSFTGKNPQAGTSYAINATVAYKTIGLVITHTAGTAPNSGETGISEMKFYGTGVDSIPIQIGGGNIDKVANFRVYNKFIEEDQALEIWDAQKEEFGRAKSSATLHKGRLGIGTDAPQGSLSVADEPVELEEFPPGVMSGGKDFGGGGGETYFTGYGKFRATASKSLQGTTYGAIKAFNKANLVNSDRWRSSGDFTNGVANTSYLLADGVTPGVWIKLEMPIKIKLARYEFVGQFGQGPGDAEIWASNDDKNWTKIHSFSGNTIGDNSNAVSYHVNSENFYKIYAMVVLKTVTLSGIDATSIKELKFFGTREQGQSVLHDGQLTLTKNLDVPRIGPALDADDTPRRDRLVVEYNTSTNPTFEGAVRDTSGRGLDGIMHTATYDANDKEIKSNGNSGTSNNGPAGTTSNSSYNDYGSFETVLPPLQGNPAFTVSGWFKQNTIANLQIPWLIGKNVRVTESPGSGQNSKMSWFGITSTGRPRIAIGGGGNLELYYTDGSIQAGKWHHMVITVQPSGTSTVAGDVTFYLDGASQSTSSTSGSSGDIDLGGGAPPRMHWFWQESSTVYYDGSASNIKVYDVALTSEEAKTLYDMGRCDEGHHVVNFSKTRVGIGLGDGDAPRGALDVRGTGKFQGLGVNTDNLIGALQVHQGPNITFGGTGDTIQDPVPGFVISSDSAKWAMFINTNDDLILTSHDSLSGTYTGVTGYILEGAYDQRMNDFTGQHRCFLRGIPREQIKDKVGLIVSSDKNKYTMISGDIVTGQNAIDISESIPDVSISQKAHDKACFGVISDVEDPEKREDLYGVFGTPFPKEKGDDRVYINSVGEGAIWVANTNGSLEAGDYITTSNIAGYGQKQGDDVLHNYTVAKITMDCDFEPATQPIQIIKKDEEGENVLDEHGQIQWEDHPTETERAYKVRYLTTDGIQTDEANAVHIAAFVGCTYHCG